MAAYIDKIKMRESRKEDLKTRSTAMFKLLGVNIIIESAEAISFHAKTSASKGEKDPKMLREIMIDIHRFAITGDSQRDQQAVKIVTPRQDSTNEDSFFILQTYV